jgi:predicted TPR repeat methyltransferase
MSQVNMAHKLPRTKLVANRAELITRYCKDKNVLHLGCVASGSTIESFNDNSLLHLQILKVAKRAIGIDIDEKGIEFLTKQGIPDLIVFDAQNLSQLQLNLPIDVIVAGEIIEHVPNPGLLLKGASQLLDKNKSKSILIVTVPNAFSLRHFVPVFLNKKEFVLPDHNFYFSYSTLKALLESCGLNLIDFYTYSNLNKNLKPLKRFAKNILNNTILKFSPFSAEGLIAIAGKNSG